MCCGPTAKWKREEVPLHKFDFIDVEEFREESWVTRMKYSTIFLLVLKSVLMYVADVWTATILLVSGGDWQAAGLRPAIRLDYARIVHLFSIVCSFLLLAWEVAKARVVLQSRDIGLAYTSPFCYRFLVLRSYPHYCFFANITRSQKTTDKMAFFVFFVLKGWKRVLFAEAPRQLVNGVTMYALLTTNPDVPTDRNINFVRVYKQTSKDAAPFLAICSMAFAFTIFVLSALLSLFAVMLYFPLLYRIRGNLKEYCCHKIDKRIGEIMKKRTRLRVALEAKRNLIRQYQASVFPESSASDSKDPQTKLVFRQPTLPRISEFEVEYRETSGRQQPVIQARRGFQPAALTGVYDAGLPLPSMSPRDTARVMYDQPPTQNSYYQRYPTTEVRSRPIAFINAPPLRQADRTTLNVDVRLRTMTSPANVRKFAQHSANDDALSSLTYMPVSCHMPSRSEYRKALGMPYYAKSPVRASSLLCPMAADSLSDPSTIRRREQQFTLSATEPWAEEHLRLAYTRRRRAHPTGSEHHEMFPPAPEPPKAFVTDVTKVAAARRHLSQRSFPTSKSAIRQCTFRRYQEAGITDVSLPNGEPRNIFSMRLPAVHKTGMSSQVDQVSAASIKLATTQAAASASKNAAGPPLPITTVSHDDVSAPSSPPFASTSYADPRESFGGVTSFSFSFGNAPPIDDDSGGPRTDGDRENGRPGGDINSFANDSLEDDPFESTVLNMRQSVMSSLYDRS